RCARYRAAMASQTVHSATSRPAYEFRVLTLPATTRRADLRQLLTDEAVYGRWELARHRIYTGGARKVWLRRQIIRVRRTLTRRAPVPSSRLIGPQLGRNPASTRTPNCTDSTGTRSSTPWNMPAKSSSGGSGSCANP